MSAHTPGPWVVVNDGTDDEPMMTVKAARIAGRPPRHCVAICATGDSPQEMENANARLIAAAPDILEALRKADDLLGFHEGSAKPEFEGARPTVRINGEDHAELLAVLRAAIAKAEGRT